MGTNEYPKMLYPQRVIVNSIEEENSVRGITVVDEAEIAGFPRSVAEEIAASTETPQEQPVEVEPVKAPRKRKKKE